MVSPSFAHMTITEESWESYAQALETFIGGQGGSFYHTAYWQNVLTESYGYESHLWVARDSQKKILGFFPIYCMGRGGRRRWVSIPWADFGGPLSSSDAVQDALMTQALDRAFSVVMRRKPEKIPSHWNVENPYCHFLLSVERPFETVLKTAYHQKTRNMIFKAERNGVHVRRMPLAEGLAAYYPIFYETMKKLRILPFNQGFFQQVATHCQDKAQLFLAEWKGKVVAGLIGFSWDGTFTIWSNASQQEALSVGANNAAYSGAIQYACEEKSLHTVDFGSTIKGTSHHFFKERWGGEPHDLYRVSNTPSAEGGPARQRQLMSVLQYMPSALVRGVARCIYRYY